MKSKIEMLRFDQRVGSLEKWGWQSPMKTKQKKNPNQENSKWIKVTIDFNVI